MKKKKIILFISINLLLASCNKENFNIENLNGNKIIALGHGGMGLESIYPMNSFESAMECLQIGSNGVEMDIQMTKDSILVFFHDEHLSQKTNFNGKVADYLWEDLKKANYHVVPYIKYSLVSLDDILTNIPDKHKFYFSLDCKLYSNSGNILPNFATYSEAIIRTVEKNHLQNNIYIESMSEEFLKIFKAKRPDYKLLIYSSSFEHGLEIALNHGLYGISIANEKITKEQVQVAHKNNLYVALWDVVSDSENKEAIKKNPDIIQSDHISDLVKKLE